MLLLLLTALRAQSDTNIYTGPVEEGYGGYYWKDSHVTTYRKTNYFQYDEILDEITHNVDVTETWDEVSQTWTTNFYTNTTYEFGSSLDTIWTNKYYCQDGEAEWIMEEHLGGSYYLKVDEGLIDLEKVPGPTVGTRYLNYGVTNGNWRLEPVKTFYSTNLNRIVTNDYLTRHEKLAAIITHEAVAKFQGDASSKRYMLPFQMGSSPWLTYRYTNSLNYHEQIYTNDLDTRKPYLTRLRGGSRGHKIDGTVGEVRTNGSIVYIYSGSAQQGESGSQSAAAQRYSSAGYPSVRRLGANAYYSNYVFNVTTAYYSSGQSSVWEVKTNITMVRRFEKVHVKWIFQSKEVQE